MVSQVNIQTQMSASQARFALLIEPFPWLSKYWNWKNKECDIDTLKDAMCVMSHGERILAQFYLSVWTHNPYGFDLLEAASILDQEDRQIISNWLSEPFWP